VEDKDSYSFFKKLLFLFSGSYLLLVSVHNHYISDVCCSVWPKFERKLDIGVIFCIEVQSHFL